MATSRGRCRISGNHEATGDPTPRHDNSPQPGTSSSTIRRSKGMAGSRERSLHHTNQAGENNSRTSA